MAALRRFALLLLVWGTALLIVLALGEQIARRHRPGLAHAVSRQSRPENLFMRFDPRLGWTPIPGRRVRFRRLDFDTEVTINSDGYRGPVIPYERTPEKSRLLILGDSFAFGHGVEDDETVAADLSRSDPGLEVVNLAVTGYATDQEYLLLRERGLRWNPDVVACFLCANDFHDNARSTAWGLYWKPRFIIENDSLKLEREILPSRVSFGMRLDRELNRRFVLYEMIGWRIHGLREKLKGQESPGMTLGAGVGASVAPTLGAGALITRRLISRMARLTATSGAEFVLVKIPPIPSPEALDGLPPKGEGCALDLATVFEPYSADHPDSALTFEHDPHWTPLGNRLAAEALLRLLRTEGWLAPGSSGVATPTPRMPTPEPLL